jgi:hypothetical protein
MAILMLKHPVSEMGIGSFPVVVLEDRPFQFRLVPVLPLSDLTLEDRSGFLELGTVLSLSNQHMEQVQKSLIRLIQ